jgi:hypothetical protein
MYTRFISYASLVLTTAAATAAADITQTFCVKRHSHRGIPPRA